MIISIRAEKVFEKNLTPFSDKNDQQIWNKREHS